MLKAFIVDDEPLARDELTYILRRSKKVEIVGEGESFETALVPIERLKPDAVFLDIQLAEESGLELARRLAELDHTPEVVFATAYDEYALKAFELDAVDYILKPFDEMRIQQTVDKIGKLLQMRRNGLGAPIRPNAAAGERPTKLAVLIDERIILVDMNKIIYISAIEGKTVVAAEGRKYTMSEPLVSVEQKLLGSPIVRVHRAYLVNLDAIVEIQPWFHSTYNLIMKDGSQVPVSRTYMKELKRFIGI